MMEEDDFRCQFCVPEDELVECDGEFWCVYHLPMVDKSGGLTEKGKWSGDEVSGFNEKFVSDVLSMDRRAVPSELVVGSVEYDRSCDWGDFRGVVFPGDIDISSIYFSGPVDFSNSVFVGDVYFIGCRFDGDVTFTGSLFMDEVNFYNARFGNGLFLEKCNFEGRLIIFQYSSKGGYLDSDDRRLIKSINMSGSLIRGTVMFDNREFVGTTDFRGCVFDLAPTFYGCSLHQETFFPSFECFRDTGSPEAFQAYRVLKLSMENVRNRVDEGSFFALEQRSLRKSKSWKGRYISFSFLYDLISLYGISSVRPLAWLAGMTILFALVYYKISGVVGVAGSLELSLQQIVRPYALWGAREMMSTRLDFPDVDFFVVRVLSAVQSTISLVLVTLFVFALRWRYKRG